MNIKIEKFKKYLQALEENLNITQIKNDEFKKSYCKRNSPMNEAETRAELIDPALRELGWIQKII